jgi:nitrate/TMAO reductase-like tetraheme cytochrome c subunit
MFKNRHSKADAAAIPADLLATIHSPQARRKRWIVEILVSLIIVVGLLLAGMLLYKKVHHSSEPHSVPKSNAEHVTQSPQHTTNPQNSTSAPAKTPASNSTNDTTLPMPN